MKKKIYFLAAVLCVMGAGIYGVVRHASLTRHAGEGATAGKPVIVTSFYPLYFFTTQIVGERAKVYNVTPAGAEPHDYEPTPADIEHIDASALLIVNGNLEPWLEKVKNDLAQTHTPILMTGEHLVSQNYIDEGGNTAPDPHVWLDPVLASSIAGKIADAMSQIDPIHHNEYLARASALQNKLQTLDAAYRAGLAHCAQKDIITSHAAFGYLANEYGLTQVAIAGLSPDAEPSPKNMAGIVQLAREKHIKYVFFESLASPKLSETIAQEVGASTLVLNPLEGITQEEVAKGKDYFTEMENNLKNLQVALGCGR